MRDEARRFGSPRRPLTLATQRCYTLPMGGAEANLASVTPRVPEGWALEDDFHMPDNRDQDRGSELVVSCLARRPDLGWVARNMALRWSEEHPQVGVDTDVMLLPSEPPGAEHLKSVRTWIPGHLPPRVALEFVSEGTASKDYGVGVEKYDASGTRELWVFDPFKLGPSHSGGPFVLQVYRRSRKRKGRKERFERVYAGDGPAPTEELGAWLVVTDGGCRLRLAEDPEGVALWPTGEEAERAGRVRAEAELERLRAELERLRQG
ncbi:MAG: Uma2 family endonuclease [Deltaproteobacteria bacterium]|nr:Uma2 family endonuclease [Deltaproteobacteria bacterium]